METTFDLIFAIVFFSELILVFILFCIFSFRIDFIKKQKRLEFLNHVDDVSARDILAYENISASFKEVFGFKGKKK